MSERADAFIERSKSEMYATLIKDTNSIFYGFLQIDLYIAAAAVGYHEKKRLPISDRQGIFQVQTMKNQEGLWIIKSIGAATNGLDSLKSLKDAVTICSEYANYGIDILYKIYQNSDNLLAETAERLMDLCEET